MNAKDILRHVAPKIESQIDALELALAMIDVAFETTTWTQEQSANLKTESFNTVRIFVVSAINSLFKNNGSGVRSIFQEQSYIESTKPSNPPAVIEETEIEKRIARIIRVASAVTDYGEAEILVQITSVCSERIRHYDIDVNAIELDDDDGERNLYRVSAPSILKAISLVEEVIVRDIGVKKLHIQEKFNELNGLIADLVPVNF